MRTYLYVCLLIIVAANSAAAQEVTDFVIDWGDNGPGVPRLMNACPAGDGDYLSEVHDVNGNLFNSMIRVKIEVSWPFPHFATPDDIPTDSVYLYSVYPDDLYRCANDEVVIAEADYFLPSTREWVFNSPFRLGGYDVVQVGVAASYVGDFYYSDEDATFQIITPDLSVYGSNPDTAGRVALPDLQIFTVDFYGNYKWRSDFVWDSTINLSDLGWFTAHYTHSCGAGRMADVTLSPHEIEDMVLNPDHPLWGQDPGGRGSMGRLKSTFK